MARQFFTGASFADDVTIGVLTSGKTAQLVVNQEGGVAPVAKFMSRTNKAIVQISDNDTTGYVSSENGLFSLGRNPGVNANNLNINASHNIGIGTSAPNHKLDIYSNENVPLRIHRPNNANLDSSGAWGIGFSTRGDSATSTTDTRAGIFSAYNGDLFFAVDSGGRVDDDPDGNVAMWIEGANKNIGIGTTSPSSKLHIDSTSDAMHFTRSGQETYRIIHGTSGLYFSKPNSGGLAFGVTQNSDFDTFDSSGNVLFRSDASTARVGIGTTSPDHKLHVEFANTDTAFSGGGAGAWGSEGIRIENTSSTANTMAMLHFRNNDADIHIAGIRKGTDDSDLGFFFEGTQKVLFENDGTATFAGILDINGTGTSTFAGPISISPPSSTGWQGLTITGSGTSHTQGAIILKSSTTNTPEARGQGVFMFNEGDDSTWYTGTQYQDADTWMLGRKAGTSLDTSAATSAQAFLEVNNSGNTTFAGKINAKGGASISGFTSATINAFSATVSSNLYSALRIIDNTAASSYWDVGATGNASTLLNFYHNGGTSPKVSFTHTGNATFAGNLTVSGGTITLGNDVSLFDDGVNILRTDDIFHANNSIHVGGDGKLYDRANTANYIELANTIGISTNTNISGTLTATNITSTSNSGVASIHINSTRPTLGFSDTNSYTDGADVYIIRGTGGNKLAFQWYDNSASSTTETFNIDKDGIATFNGKIRNSSGSAGAPSYSFTSFTDDGIYRENYVTTKSMLSFATEGTRRGRIGEFGIWSDANIYATSQFRSFASPWKATAGTSGAGFRFENTADSNVLLDIDSSGNADFAGAVDATNFKINGAQGSDGQVLTSTGSGVAWENPTGGGTIDGSGASNRIAIWSDSDTLTSDSDFYVDGDTIFTTNLEAATNVVVSGTVKVPSIISKNTNQSLFLYANGSGHIYFGDSGNGNNLYHYSTGNDGKYTTYDWNSNYYRIGTSATNGIWLNDSVRVTGNLGVGAAASAKLHVTIPQETDGSVRNELARFTHTSQNTMSIFAYGGSTDLMQIGAWNNEQNISIVTDTLSSISATSTKGIYIKSGGNVGIANINPAYKLDVGGTSRIGGTIHMYGAVRNYSGNFSLQNGVQDADIFFKVNDGGTTTTAMTVKGSSSFVGIGTATPLEKLHVKYQDTAGISTVYSKGLIEDTDAQLDLLSTSSGTWGSSLNFVEAAGSDANTDVWSIARKTTGGSGDSSLNFNFGTNNQHNNTRRVAFSSAGNITMGGDLTVEGGDIYIDDTNTRLYRRSGTGNAATIQTNSGYIDIGPQNTSHAHITTDRTNFYFNKFLYVDTGIISSYNEDLSLRRAGADAGSVNLNIGMLYSKSVNDSQVQLGGFTINTSLEDTYHCYIPGISPNEFAGAHRRLTVTATKNGTSISAASLGPAFLAHEETYSVSVANTDTIIIEIAGWGLSYGQWYGIAFGASQWRAKDIDIEISTDNGANYTNIYSENNQPHATVRTYHGGNNVSFNKIRYTLTNWNTTSTRINHIFAYKYLEGDTNYLDKFRDESIYAAINWKDGYPATFGNSGDLVIKHSGSDSIIETHASLSAGDLYIKSQGTNHDLYLQAADDIFIKPQNGENGINVYGNGAVHLYHDNDLRLNTTSTGARFTKQQNAGSRLELYNNRQDLSNVEVFRIAAYNSVEVTGVHFYRGGGGSSGYTKIFAKKNNASSLEEVVQFGTNDSLLSEFQGPVTINGDLQVTGTTTTVNQTNLDVSDNIIGLNRGASSNSNDSGLIIKRGSTGDNAAFLWDESEDRFIFGTTTATASSTGNISFTSAPFGGKGLWTTTSAVTHWGPGVGGTAYGTLTWDTGYAAVHANGSNVLRLGSGSDTDAVIIDGSDMSVAGNITHHGLTPTDGTDIDQVKDFAMTFQLTANTWTDTGIDSTDLATGTYAMQAYVSDFSVGGGHYYEYYSAMISWYGSSTNSTHVDEIPVHRAGHAPNNGDVQFRTERHGSGVLMLQVKHNMSYSAALNNSDGGKIFRFKFRRLI